MAGNKHKNGIVCMFPGCEKKMRTQKFKGHFVKAHLREGEEYTVDHRRQYEVAQTEPLADSDTASAAASPLELMGAAASTPKIKAEPPKRASLDMAKKVADAMAAGMVPADFAAEPPRMVEPEDAATSEPSAAAPIALPPPQNVVVASAAPVRAKRPAAAISNDAPTLAGVVPPSLDDSTMVKMLVLMDRRFSELSAKMDEMAEMQRLLISALMSKEAAAVEEQAAKKRKESTGSNTTIV